MDELYSGIKVKKLKFKGDKKTVEEVEPEPDTIAHGGWRLIKSLKEIKRAFSVAIELKENQYMFSQDNGKIRLGRVHPPSEPFNFYSIDDPPDPEEIFTCIRIDHKIAFKSGYEKYVGIDHKSKDIVGMSAMSTENEMFHPVFESVVFILSNLRIKWHYMEITVTSCPVLMSMSPVIVKKTDVSEIEDSEDNTLYAATLVDTEYNFVRRYQSFQYGKIMMTKEGEDSLFKADGQGQLHREMLDRRIKMKSDKYCR
ncbi:protein FRG1 homolog [Octopus sinensis]|uniref:Protein FRG1 homolog n=1 Tax=Octopus sinensis TaxID=2607531 RepID=A0A7E6FUY3_9MOLL|nr:protein FRG1 homolog [Octopus sinensis]